MSLRISSGIALAGLLTACGANTSPEPEGSAVECAIGPGAELEAVCTLETVSQDEIVIHLPDGGFRRFTRAESMGFMPADGADQFSAIISGESGSEIETYVIDDERYAIPRAALPSVSDE